MPRSRRREEERPPPRSSRASLRVLTIGPHGTKVTRFAIESKVTESLFAQRPYIHVSRPVTAPAPVQRAPRPLKPPRRRP